MKSAVLAIFSIIVIFNSSMISAAVPLSYEFEDDSTDARFYNFDNNSYYITQNPGIGEFEIHSVGYDLDRYTGLLTFSLRTTGPAVVNSSFYISVTLEFENTTSKISVRTYYGLLGSTSNSSVNESRLDIFYQSTTNSFDEKRDILTYVSSSVIYWQFSPTIVDIVSIFDNPEMLLSTVRAELEYSINGTSSFPGGDYYRDEFEQTEFDFSGAVQRSDTDEGIWDILDPFAVVIYLAVPIIITVRFFLNKFVKN